MSPEQIAAKLRRIGEETDLCQRALLVAMLVAGRFRDLGYETAVVGGSAIEFYTSGDYMSGDVDLAFVGKIRPEPRTIAEALAPLGEAAGTIRTFKIGGIFVDILGELDTWADTPLRELRGEDSDLVRLIQPEDLLPHRLLVATYPTEQPLAMQAARKLLAVCLRGEVQVDWVEMRRVAALPAYGVAEALTRLLGEAQSPPLN